MKKTTGFAMKVLTLVLAVTLVLGTSGVKAYAATDSPDYSNELMDMVFSIKKPTINSNDKTLNGNGFDGKPLADYYQIHEDTSKTGDPGRYAVAVSGPAVSAAIDRVLNEYTDSTNYNGIHNINETDALNGNGDQSGLAEKVLEAVLGSDLDDINELAAKYLKARLGIAPETNATVTIDWYVVKHQGDNRVGGRYHVDGNATVTIIEYDNWTVAYTFEMKDADPARIELKDKLVVLKGEPPVFGENDILAPSAVNEELSDNDYILTVNEDGTKFVLTGDKTIEIRYELVKEETKEEEQTGDPIEPKDPAEKEEPAVEPEQPKEEPEQPKEEPKNEVPFIIIPSFIDNEPEEETAEEIPVTEPATPEAAPEEEEIPVEEPGTPEGAPVEEEPEEEEIPVDEPLTPEGAPEEEEEEEIPVDLPATPEGDVLPQTGVASAAVFFGFGASFIGVGAFVIGKLGRKEEI